METRAAYLNYFLQHFRQRRGQCDSSDSHSLNIVCSTVMFSKREQRSHWNHGSSEKEADLLAVLQNIGRLLSDLGDLSIHYIKPFNEKLPVTLSGGTSSLFCEKHDVAVDPSVSLDWKGVWLWALSKLRFSKLKRVFLKLKMVKI